MLTKVAFCNGYVQAHFEALSYEGVVSPGGGLSGNQLVAVVNKFLSAHPDQWSLPAGGLVRFVLVGCFPCTEEKLDGRRGPLTMIRKTPFIRR